MCDRSSAVPTDKDCCSQSWNKKSDRPQVNIHTLHKQNTFHHRPDQLRHELSPGDPGDQLLPATDWLTEHQQHTFRERPNLGLLWQHVILHNKLLHIPTCFHTIARISTERLHSCCCCASATTDETPKYRQLFSVALLQKMSLTGCEQQQFL